MMLGFFKNKNEKILGEIKAFEHRVNQKLTPMLKKPSNPKLGNSAIISMCINMAFHFLAIRNFKVFEKSSPYIISHIAANYGSMVHIGSEGRIGHEEAAISLIYEMQTTQEAYSEALSQSPYDPEGAFNDCLDIFIENSGGWLFKSEMDRFQAVILLCSETGCLMNRFKGIV